ncbi:MAG: hypothetical protein HKP57_04185 [Halobacteria archaeon]|nr:hypothetical protein [Halobacteria archaeon]
MQCRAEDPPAVQVLDCIQDMGAQHSNPVLELLRDLPAFVQGKKYPQPALAFGEDDWRCYYHSHSVADADAREHGHFHLFTRTGEGWAHLAALAMDREGQPLRWVMTNRWVTDGDWRDRNSLLAAIDALVSAKEPDVLRRWLASLLQLYQPELGDLLDARDARIAGLLHERSRDAVLDDRTLYELASMPIDLAAKLTSQLTGETS